MSATPKRPLSAAQGRVSNENAPPAGRPRASTPTSTNGNGTSTTPQRTRSIRGGTPMSARAAASHRASSSLSISTTNGNADARAELVALIDDLKERLQKSDATSEQYRKQTEVLQTRLDDATKEQAKLEDRLHENEEQIESFRNDKRETAKKMREMETIYEAERSSMTKEKEEMGNREEEMQAVINRLKETLNQRNAEDEYRPTRQSNNSSPSVDSGNFAPPSSVQRSDSRNNSKLLLQKDKLIESLRLELAEAQIKLVESENQGGGRLHEVERLLMEARMANARLMEDNESYQLLLQEKTLHGDFGKGDFSYMNVAANQDALNALEGRSNAGDNPTTPGASLADELGALNGDESPKVHAEDDTTRRLEAEVRAAKDQNKALTLYINKIIERLLQHQEFEHILDQSSDFKPGANVHKDLPPPPTDSPGVGASLLQRAKSIATGGPQRPKPRPMTMSASHQLQAQMAMLPSVLNNPDTAPSIPLSGLGRSHSTARRIPGRPMSEQLTGAAGIVNAMYKGPDGPLSPTLSTASSSARHSQTFFGGNRVSSSIGHNGSSGNFPGMRSETSSVSGDSAADGTTGTMTSSSQSPPRTVGSGSISGEKSTTMTGNKPRPLRLVQEKNESEREQNKRASWLGWAQGAWTKKEGEDVR
ncbi:uncharacterized protein GGS22DRAFT_55296 [Annulohypoxylon maeteangense]|uniref:uncharacterized protein n=1 Tax=Annulohypoxylon maeteangense TaxID=1927788 RepID=UPI002007A678|nr:uncharacterized protein GGS22DRAFT_55296 [Annulohypoxylon maeteangense]KAI0881709.1 hypothetical protein GGS22DRAFT_55296 [Annulohypoxylon maeteangense]